MSTNFGTMVPGANIRFSIDMVNKLPQGATLSAAAITMRAGDSCAAVSIDGRSGSQVFVRVIAAARGYVSFSVDGDFSNGEGDSEIVSLQVI